MKPSTYANVESSPFKVIRRERAAQVATFYKLDETARDGLLAAWDRLPLSEYGERQRERWAKRNKLRSKARNHDRLKLALVETLALLLTSVDDPNVLCNCLFGGGTPGDPTRSCELCSALEALGFDGYAGKLTTIDQLSRLQDRLEAGMSIITNGDRHAQPVH